MPKTCPQCHKTYEAGKFCLDCGIPLVEQQMDQQPSEGGFNLNLGDANAISGGVTMSDSHSVSHNTVNTSTNTVDSHNVITNNITHVEREKSKEERLLEGKQAFREACKQAFTNGMCTSEEKRRLDDLRFKLGLDDETSAQIFENVRMSIQRKSVVLGPIQKMTFEKIKSAILNNKLDIIQRLYPQLVAMVQKFAVEELQFTYYMLQSVLSPDACVKDYESHREDKYWQTFWAAVAYRKVGDIIKAESLLVDVGSKWTDTTPEENTYVLAVIGAVLDNDMETATNLYNQVTGGQSLFLEPLVGCLYGILYADMVTSDEVKQMVNNGAFYRNQLFASISLKNNTENLQKKKYQPEEQATSQPVEKNIEEPLISESASSSKSTGLTEVKVNEVEFDNQILNRYINEFGYMRKLSKTEVIELKSLLLSAPQDNYKAQFSLGQLYLQESDTASQQRLAYDCIKSASEHGIYEAGAYMAYFYIYGKVVKQDLDEAERRIKIDDDYKKNPFFIQLLVDLYAEKGNNLLADVWRTKLSKLK